MSPDDFYVIPVDAKAIIRMDGGYYPCRIVTINGLGGFFFEFGAGYYLLLPDGKTSSSDFEWIEIKVGMVDGTSREGIIDTINS